MADVYEDSYLSSNPSLHGRTPFFSHQLYGSLDRNQFAHATQGMRGRGAKVSGTAHFPVHFRVKPGIAAVFGLRHETAKAPCATTTYGVRSSRDLLNVRLEGSRMGDGP